MLCLLSVNKTELSDFQFDIATVIKPEEFKTKREKHEFMRAQILHGQIACTHNVYRKAGSFVIFFTKRITKA